MPSILNIRLGIEIEGQKAPFVINSIDDVNEAVRQALALLEASIIPRER